MKNLIKEFREFINRGNVVDLAVAVIIGGAFTGVVTSLTENVINPVIQLLTGAGGDMPSFLVITIGSATVNFSAFISSIINFLIVAAAVFALVKAMNKADELSKKAAALAGIKQEEAAPVEKPPVCPFCKTEIPEGATRCPHCTSELPEPAKKTVE